MTQRNRLYAMALGIVFLTASISSANAQDTYQVRAWTLTAGGIIEASAEEFELSGSFGQWDGTMTEELTESDIALTGGFWSVTVIADVIFRDSFSGDPVEMTVEE